VIHRITDKALLRRRLSRAHARAGAGTDFLLAAAISDLTERLDAIERRFPMAVAHGGRTDRLAQAIAASGRAGLVVRMEQDAGPPPGREFAAFVADEEALPLAPQSIDLFASALAFQWTDDLPGALIQIRRALRPDGLLIAAMTGGRTLTELREALFAAETELRGGASPRIMPAIDVQDVGALLQRAGFALPVTDRDALTVRYDSAFHLFRDLRAMGATNVLVDRERRPASRRLFTRAAEIYAERFSDPDGRIRATFEIVWLSGWAPHESQQKPAQRGSAAINLADVLGSGKRGGR
jgi:SAM-dependent methyltransferase